MPRQISLPHSFPDFSLLTPTVPLDVAYKMCFTVHMEWYALRVRTGTDFSTVERLIDMGLEIVCPFQRVTVKHRRTKAKIQKYFPVLPGYVFARLADSSFELLKRVGDVVGYIRDRATGKPQKIDEEVVSLLHDAQDKGVYDNAKSIVRFVEGEKVQFDFLGKVLDVIVTKVKDGLVTAKATLGGTTMQVQRPEAEFRSV